MSVALISGGKLAYMWQFVSVWTSELARTRLLAKKKKKTTKFWGRLEEIAVFQKTGIESTFYF